MYASVMAIRHSKLELTMGLYTDPRPLDVAGAVEKLPTLPLRDGTGKTRAKATGTDATLLVPTLVPTPDNPGMRLADAGKTARAGLGGRNVGKWFGCRGLSIGDRARRKAGEGT